MIRRAALTVAILVALPVAAVAQDAPAAMEESREHTVVAGETLWSIARQYFGSPFEWRQIYEANQNSIANPNWIEPGQRLVIPAGGASMASAPGQVDDVQVRTVPRETSRPIQVVRTAARVPGRTVFYAGATSQTEPEAATVVSSSRTQDAAVLLRAVPHDVFYAAGWLIEEEGTPSEVIGVISELADDQEGRVERLSVMPFERVRVEIDGPSPQIGEQLLVVRTGRRIKDIGDVVVPTGIVTVSKHEEPGVVGVLSNEYDRVQLGDLVIPLPAFNMEPGVVAAATNSELEGEIVSFRVNKEVQSLGDIVFLSLGLGDGVRVGDEFVVDAPTEAGWTGDVIGRMQVVGVRADQSIARIVDLEAPLFEEGLAARLVARMP